MPLLLCIPLHFLDNPSSWRTRELKLKLALLQDGAVQPCGSCSVPFKGAGGQVLIWGPASSALEQGQQCTSTHSLN